MDRKEFSAFRDQHYATIAGINDRKGKDYAGDDDALANFKAAAEQLGVEPEIIWAVYAHKHWSAVMSYCKNGQVESEPIEGRVHDAILYLFLLLGLIADADEADVKRYDGERCQRRSPAGSGHRCGQREGHSGPHRDLIGGYEWAEGRDAQ